MKLFFPFFFSAVILCICSCKKNEKEAPPIETISFTGISNHAVISGTVTAQLTVSGASNIKKYEVYVNDSLLTTGTTPSYSFS